MFIGAVLECKLGRDHLQSSWLSCTHCGKVYNADSCAKYCARCGAKLQTVTSDVSRYRTIEDVLAGTDYKNNLYLLYRECGASYLAGNLRGDGTELKPGIITQSDMDKCIQNFNRVYSKEISCLKQQGCNCHLCFIVI